MRVSGYKKKNIFSTLKEESRKTIYRKKGRVPPGSWRKDGRWQ